VNAAASKGPALNGVLIVDKPSGPTSFDVVHKVRALLKVKKAGHTGTLDPMATGVLPICLGEATKIAGLLTLEHKAYEAVIRLGAETDTLDAQGKVVAEKPVPPLDAVAVERALAKFRGAYEQVPPMFSAVKVAGRRLYEAARAGEEVPREPRQVVVHELSLLGMTDRELTVRVRCSKGFFVRVLAQQLGRELGTFGHIQALRRTASGDFGIDRAVTLDRLASLAAQPEAIAALLVPPTEALQALPALTVSADDEPRVGNGVRLEVGPELSGRLRVLAPGGRLLALAEVGEDHRLRYLRVMA
jgi:tRNA pseudouridine55 synthase